MDTASAPIDCACVIHGDAYDWIYVDRLYTMLSRNLSYAIQLHVYTEPDRPVPLPYIKHALEDWGLRGPKQSWWYKIQLFDTSQHSGSLLYFDLDTVIVNNIDWITQLPAQYFWTIQDFKFLWKPTHQGINSSIMRWDTTKFDHIYRYFKSKDLKSLMRLYHGDQEYLTQQIPEIKRRFLDTTRIKSWRWQCLDGGYDFSNRCYNMPGTGTILTPETDVLIFHGRPKPDKITDPVVTNHWR